MTDPNRTELPVQQAAARRPTTDTIDRLLGRRVRVESRGGQRFEGNLAQVWLPERDVRLLDVQELPSGATSPEAHVSDVDWIVAVSGEIRIRVITPADIEPCTFAVDDPDIEAYRTQNDQAIDELDLGNIPVVAPVQDELVVVEGHKRLWAARQADISNCPVMAEELSSYQRARRFAHDHFPIPATLDNDRLPTFYTDREVRASLERYFDELGEEALSIFPVQFNADQLGMKPQDMI